MTNNEILREFLLETHENLALLDADLLTLEKRPTEKHALAQVFRTLHSVKGTAGFMGLVKLQSVAHASESLLSRLRAGEMTFNPTIATALLQVVDAIREMLSHIESSGGEGDGDYTALIGEIDRLRDAGDEGRPSSLPAVPEPAAEDSGAAREQSRASVTPQPDETTDLQSVSLPLPSKPVLSTPTPPAPTPPAPTPPAPTPPAPTPPAPTPPAPPPPAPPPAECLPVSPPQVSPTPPPSLVNAAQAVSPSPATAPETAPPPAEVAPSEPAETRSSMADTSIRVDVHLLDKLMTLMGELVLARNQILQYSALHEDSVFLGTVQRLNVLTTELQTSVMKTRMQPIGNVLNKFPRIVRDLALACGKKVRFEMEGQDTELDKTLLEAIRDPLTHMVRNAIDHGIEPPAVRKAQGKPDEGRLRMVAFHEGGKVIVEISDDGGGIDVARVREKALQAKLVSPEAAARMSHQELLRLIFLPGFSTAERVTQFSGRGVGMDVVRTNIEKIGGTVDLESRAGQGTTIRTKIPLTLAIIPALIIASGRERYAIPQVSLLELVRLDADQAEDRIEWLHGVPVFRLRGALLPLVFLNEQLQREGEPRSAADVNIVVLQADERQFGLVVDGIRDTEEIVVKPLQKQLKGISVFAGAAIMGDGRVALVLDVLGLAQRASVVAGSKSRALAEHERPAAPAGSEMEPLLLFAPSAGGQMAIPLSQVARLEEFPRSKLEYLGQRQVVQYRGEILSLIDVSRELARLQTGRSDVFDDAVQSAETIPVVVYAQENHHIGLMVDKILDIVPDPVATRSRASRPGVLFNAIVQERVTEVVDVAAILRDSAVNLWHQPT